MPAQKTETGKEVDLLLQIDVRHEVEGFGHLVTLVAVNLQKKPVLCCFLSAGTHLVMGDAETKKYFHSKSI